MLTIARPCRRSVLHALGDEAREPERRREVQVDHARELLSRRAQRRGGRAGAGVVDEPVDAAVTLDHGVDQAAAVVLVGDVAGHDVRARDLLAQRGQAVGAARGHHRHGPGLGERARQLLAEAGTGPGHDHYTVLQFGAHRSCS